MEQQILSLELTNDYHHFDTCFCRLRRTLQRITAARYGGGTDARFE